MTTENAVRRRWYHYSIRALLFFTLLVAGLLAGYPVGKKLGFRAAYDAGFRSGEESRRVQDSLQVIVYPVADLVSTFDANGQPIPGQADFDILINLITRTIDDTSWDEVGGPGSIHEFETNLTLVVTQSPDVHEKIRVLLADLRKKPGWKAIQQARLSGKKLLPPAGTSK